MQEYFSKRENMKMEVKTLRQQNQTLLNKLRTGQDKFRHILDNYKPGVTENGQKKFILADGNTNLDTLQSTLEQLKTNMINIKNSNLEPNLIISTNNRHKSPVARKHLSSLNGKVINKEPTYRRVAQGWIDSDNFSDSENLKQDMTSTPKKETPKSILKRRKIIEDNVKVESKFQHTPSATTPKDKGLNFSYSNIDDLTMAKSMHDRDWRKPGSEVSEDETDLDGSYLEEISNQTASSYGKGYEKQDATGDVARRLREELLLSPSNVRHNAAVVRQLSLRPKSVIFDPEASVQRDMPSMNTTRDSSNATRDTSKSSTRSRLLDDPQQCPLLGYDWIAGLLDNDTSSMMNRPDDYFESIREFRRVNKDECVTSAPLENIFDATRPISPTIKDPGHTCIHGFTVNDRLYPEPLNPDEDGASVCPVCLQTRTEPTKEDPGFVRVSIPRSTLMSPYRVRPHRRGSYEPIDSVSLASHCVAGYQSSRPAMLPTASALDLQQSADGLRSKLTTSLEEATNFADLYSQSAKVVQPRTLNALLDTTNALRYELQATGHDSLTSGAGNRSDKLYSVL